MNALLSLLTVGLAMIVTFRYSSRGIQNGLLFMMIAGMNTLYVAHYDESGGAKLPTLTLDRVVFATVLLVFLIKWWQGETSRLRVNWVEICMLLLVAAIFISMWTNKSYETEAGGAGGDKLALGMVLTGFIYPFMAYFIARRGIRDKDQFLSFLVGLAYVTIYLGIDSLAEAWHQNWLVFPKYILDPDQGTDFGKVRGPFLNSSFNGLAQSIGLFVYSWLYFQKRDAKRWLWVAGSVMAAITVVYSLQRAVWLGAAAGFGLVTLGWAKQRTLLMGLLVATVALGVLTVPDSLLGDLEVRLNDKDSVEFRVQVIKKAEKAIASSPIVGIGFNSFNQLEESREEHFRSHNTPLVLLAETGFLGFLPYFAIFVLVAFESIDAYYRLPESRSLIATIWGITVAYVIMSGCVELRGVPYMNILFFGLWGMFPAGVGKLQSRREMPTVNFKAN